MSKNHENQRRLASEDRAALRQEIATGGADETRLQAFDMLAKQADGPDADPPPMPDELREKLVEKFGAPAPESRAPAAASPGLFAQLREFFAGRELAYGGFAVAACALLLVVFLPKGDPPGVAGAGGQIDTLRGGGTADEATEVAVYLFPEDSAAAVVAIMNPERPAVLCQDAVAFAGRLAGDAPALAVAADLDARTVATYRGGELVGRSPIAGSEATDVLLELRAAADAATE